MKTLRIIVMTLNIILLSTLSIKYITLDQDIKDDYRFEGCLIGIYALTGKETFEFCAATIIKLNKQLAEKSE